MDGQNSVSGDRGLAPELVEALHIANPWWTGAPMSPLPPMRRHLVAQVRRRMDAEIAPIVVVRGPRQVGKTTVQQQIIADLLAEGVPPTSIMRVQFDDLAAAQGLVDPILRISTWFERSIVKEYFNALATRGQKAYLFFDEVQNLDNWSAQLKFLVDHYAVKVMVTGSSALRIERGRDSLAGRISTVEAGVLSLTEIGALRGLNALQPFLPDNGLGHLKDKEFWLELATHGRDNVEFRNEVFWHFSQRGGYPLVHNRKDVEWPLLADQLNETVIKRVIQHDLRIGERGRRRDPQILEELFRLTCRYAGQAPTLKTLADDASQSLSASVTSQRVSHYLRFLDDTLLLRLIPPLELRLKKRRGSPKICLIDHGLRASWLQEQTPLVPEALAESPDLSTLAGRLAESIFGSVCTTIPGLDLAHFPERGPDREVDFVLTVGDRRLPVEIKYQRRIDPIRDTLGIRSFVEKSVNRAPFGLIITQDDSIQIDDPRIVTMPLSTFMLLR